MEITGYGVKLTRLTEPDIEMVRNWRNSKNINDFMEYREHITPAMQKQWFNQLNALNDFYFIIEYRGTPIGLIHCSHINWEKHTGEAGLFIHNERYLSTHVPVLASLSMVDTLFWLFRINSMRAKVMSNNYVAIKYNTKLGFRPEADEAKKAFQHYVLTRETYFLSTEALRRSARLIGKTGLAVNMSGEFHHILEQHQLISTQSNEIKLTIDTANPV